MDVTDIRMGSRYPKGEGSPLLQRLCREAWEPLFDPVIDDATVQEIRSTVLRTIMTAATEDELDVLRRYHATTIVNGFVIGVPNPSGLARAHLCYGLGCSVEVPSIHARHGQVVLGALMPEGTGDVVQDGLLVPDWIGSIIQARMEAWGGYQDEDAVITRINRGVGSATWGRILSAMPRTKAHVEGLIAEGRAVKMAA